MLAILGRPARFAAALLGLVGALCMALGDEARAAWIAPVSVSTVGPDARDPQVAVDGSGDVTVAWVNGASNRAIFVAERPAGGQWTNPVAGIQATNDCHEPKLAVDSAGAAILVADCKSGTTPMRSASRSAGGTWSPSVEIPGSGSGKEPRVAIDDSGNAVVVWTTEANVVESSYRKASSGWEAAPLQVSPVGKVTREPDVTVSPTGRAIAVWAEDRDESGSDPVIQVDSISRQGSAAWSGYKFLSGTTTGTAPVVGEPTVTINGGGRIAAWDQLALSPNPTFLKNAWGSASDFGNWGEDASSHTAGEAAYGVEAPRVALDGNGRTVAVWRAFKVSNGDFGVQAATTGFINGLWSSPVTLAAGGGNGALSPDVVVDPAGDAILAWNIGGVVSALHRPAGGALNPAAVTTISNASHPPFEQTQLAIDGSGDGVATWSASDHVAVALDDVNGPVLSAIAVPAEIAVGAAAAMSASAADWSSATVAWNFGDGATAAGTTVSHVFSTPGLRTVTITATDAAGNTTTQVRQISVMAPGGGASGGGSGPGDSSLSRHRVQVTASAVVQLWAKQAKAKAVKVRCKLDVNGTCAAVATVSKPVAKLLGLKAQKRANAVVVGRGSVAVTANRFAVVNVKLNTKALAAIAASAKAVPVAIALEGTAAGNDPGAATRRLTLRP